MNFVTVKHAATVLGVSTPAIYSRINRGVIPAKQTPKGWVVSTTGQKGRHKATPGPKSPMIHASLVATTGAETTPSWRATLEAKRAELQASITAIETTLSLLR